MPSPIRIDLILNKSLVQDAVTKAEIDNLRLAVNSLHTELTGNPATLPAAATDLATCITLSNAIRARLISLGVSK